MASMMSSAFLSASWISQTVHSVGPLMSNMLPSSGFVPPYTEPVSPRFCTSA